MGKKTESSQLSLWFKKEKVGRLSISKDRNILCFEYSDHWLNSKTAFEVSRQLPLERVVFEDAAHAYFSNLLPEGKLRNILARQLGVSEENDYALLAKFGEDCAGAFQISRQEPWLHAGPDFEITLAEIQKIFENQPSAPLELLMRGKARLSLAGAQDKLAVIYRDKKIFLPKGKSPSTHIMKFPSKDMSFLVENEFEVLSLARICGLPVMNFELLGKKDFRVLMIERYDREVSLERSKSADARRIHQEDFCQALGNLPGEKYQEEGGPTFADCFNLAESRSQNLPEDLEILLRWIVFNVVIGNCDHHAKNLSFVMSSQDQWVLSPIYDLLCTKVYSGISKQQAMAIGGSFDGGNLSIKHWRNLANEIKVGANSVMKSVEEICDWLDEAVELRMREIKSDLSIGRTRANWSEELFKVIQVQIRRTRMSIRESASR